MDVFKGARKVLMGSASLKALFGEAKKVFVVCDPFIEESGTVKYVTDILTEMGVSYDVYSNIQPDPSGLDIWLIQRRTWRWALAAGLL